MFRDKVLHALRTNDFRYVELEFRLGTQGQTFCPNISKQEWTAAKNKFNNGTETNTIELYIPTKPGESKRFVAHQEKQEKYWERKVKVANETNQFEKYAVRSSLALEFVENGPPPVKASMQRKKHRTSFLKAPWKIDFTRVESIPSADRDCEETYEIEIELVDLGYLFEKEIDMIIHEGIHLCRSLL